MRPSGTYPYYPRKYLALSLFVFLYVAIDSQAQNPLDVNDVSAEYLELGKRQFELGEYEMAEASFKTVLENVQVLPAEICYYFGANSYHLQKFKQSINWLNKYIELKGTSGQYFEECTEYLAMAEEKYKALSRKMPDPSDTTDISVDYRNLPEIDCGPSGKVICPVCNGNTVIIRGDAFGKRTYKTCPYCDDHGNLTCAEYTLLLKGALRQKEGRTIE